MAVKNFSVAFYNVENLFDTKDGKYTLDKDYTPKGKKKWGPYRYQIKINKIGNALSKIGGDCCALPPLLIGLPTLKGAWPSHIVSCVWRLGSVGLRTSCPAHGALAQFLG